MHYYKLKLNCIKHFWVVVRPLYPIWHVKDLTNVTNQFLISFSVFSSFLDHWNRPRLRESCVQALARQVEDQSHEESKLWSTSKPLAKLEKGLAKLSVVRWRKTKHFARQKHQFRKVCQNLVGCAKIWQGVPNFRKVCENHFVRTDLRDFSPEL